jgi:hypothetical protein
MSRGARRNWAERPTAVVGDPSNLIRVIPAKGAAMAAASRRVFDIQPPPEWAAGDRILQDQLAEGDQFSNPVQVRR